MVGKLLNKHAYSLIKKCYSKSYSMLNLDKTVQFKKKLGKKMLIKIDFVFHHMVV